MATTATAPPIGQPDEKQKDSQTILLVEMFEGTERLSELFSLTVKAVVPEPDRDLNGEIILVVDTPPKSDLLGKKATIHVPLPGDDGRSRGKKRFFTGIISRQEVHVSKGGRRYYDFVIVPWLWLLSQRTDCRIFQDKRVEQIAEDLVDELRQDFPQLLKVDDQLENRIDDARTTRDYCVQYNETSLNFLLRLLEEEGIGFYFEHSGTGLKMVLFDGTKKRFPLCPHHAEAHPIGEADQREAEGFLLSWNGESSVTPDKYSLRDHHFCAFNYPTSRWDASSARPKTANPFAHPKTADPFASPRTGNSSAHPKTADPFARPKSANLFCTGELPRTDSGTKDRSTGLEVYQDGEGFAEPFVNQPEQRKCEVILEGDRRAAWRLDAERAEKNVYEGASTCRDFSPGYRFRRMVGKTSDPGYELLLVEVHHSAQSKESHDPGDADRRDCYHNHFRCIPEAIPFRPLPVTEKPVIFSVQTAKVVGSGKSAAATGDSDATDNDGEIYVDRFGRVRVQFHWDRRDAFDDSSSCWIRVAQGWASNGFGMHFWPRVGDEVVVAFVNGDPDRPIIVGSLYNGANMPPYELGAEKTKSGIKTRSTPGGDSSNFNEIRFEDKKGHEQLYIHAERALATVVEAGESRSVGASRKTTIHRHDKLTIQEGNREVGIAQGDDVLFVCNGNSDIDVPEGRYRVESREMLLEARDIITLKCGESKIVLTPQGVFLSYPGDDIQLTPGMININGPFVKINS